MARGGPGGGRAKRARAAGRITAFAVLAAGVSACGGDDDASPPQADPNAPNIVVVMTDDQDVASMAAMPITRREIGKRGVEFTNSYVALSECCPSRATFLTGQHAHNHGVETSKPPEGGYPALDNTNTLATWMDDAGYRTGEVGRYLNFYGNPKVGTDPKEVPPGWDDWHAPVEHTDFQVYDYVLNENGRLREYGHKPSDYATDVFSREAVEFIDESSGGDDPFFLWVTPAIPHSEGPVDKTPGAPRNPRPAPRDEGAFADTPFPRPPSFAEADTSDKPSVLRAQESDSVAGGEPDAELEASFRGRMESLIAVDRMVGRIVAALRRTGELENTYLLFTSDNGFLLGEHRQVGKHLPFEGSVRVPLLLRGPGIPAGEKRQGLVQNIDLAPTVVDAAGIDAGLEMDGTSLLPQAGTGDYDAERSLLLEYLDSKIAFSGVRSPDDLKYIAYQDGEEELYDLKTDPHELENVADDPAYAGDRERLAGELEELRDCAGSDCR